MPTACPGARSASSRCPSATPGEARRRLLGSRPHDRGRTTLAIVGDNGAGKTTLVKLLARLYEPDGGPHHGRRRRPAGTSTPPRGSAGSPPSSRTSCATSSRPPTTSASAPLERRGDRAAADRRGRPGGRRSTCVAGLPRRLGHRPLPPVHRRRRPVGRRVAADRPGAGAVRGAVGAPACSCSTSRRRNLDVRAEAELLRPVPRADRAA